MFQALSRTCVRGISVMGLGVLAMLLLAMAFSMEPARPARAATPAQIQDSPYAPRLVVIPAGEYTMGSPASEPYREDNEGPRRRVQIDYPLAVGITDVTRAEYAAFVADTGYAPNDDDGCYIYDVKAAAFDKNPHDGWKRPGFDQTDNDPVVCVSWNDANAYTAWLSLKTGHTYRLLSESEWEYAARAGTVTAYYWGNNGAKAPANCARCASVWAFKRTAPSGNFPPNAFGLYDMAGNVWQWTADCYQDSYAETPTDGEPSLTGDCGYRMLRGGSWFGFVRYARPAKRAWDIPIGRFSTDGFRVARTL